MIGLIATKSLRTLMSMGRSNAAENVDAFESPSWMLVAVKGLSAAGPPQLDVDVDVDVDKDPIE